MQKRVPEMATHRLSNKTSELKPTALPVYSPSVTHYAKLFALPLAVEATIMARLQDVSDEVCLAASFSEQFLVLIITRRVESSYRPIEENDSCLVINFAAVNPKRV